MPTFTEALLPPIDAGPPPAPAAPPKPTIALLSWRPMLKNTLRGFAVVRLPIGLIIHDCAVHVREQRRWVSLPGKPVTGADGRPVRDPSTGKITYVPVVAWPTREVADAFSRAVLALVEAAHSGALDAHSDNASWRA